MRKIIATVFFGLGMTMLKAEILPSTTPAKAPIPAPRVHMDVQALKTAKGLNFWMVQNQEIPVVSVTIAFRNAGSKADPEDKLGVCDLVTTLVMEGAGEMDTGEFEEMLNEKNIQLSVVNNKDITIVNIRVPSAEIGAAFEATKLVFSKPRFDESAVERVTQQAILSLKQATFNEKHRLRELMAKKVLDPHHSYARTTEQILGCIKNITVSDMKAFMQRNYCQDNMVVSVCGNITPQKASLLLDDFAAVLPAHCEQNKIDDVTLQTKGETFVDKLDIPQTVIGFIQPGLKRHDPQFYAAYLLMKIVGDNDFESRLFKRVREQGGLTYGIGAALQWQDHSAYISGVTSTQNASVATVIEMIKDEWRKVIKDGVAESELRFAKDHLMGGYPLMFTTTRDIAHALVTYQLEGLPVDYINTRNDILEQVTLEQVNAVAKQLLSIDKLVFLTVGMPQLKAQKGTKKLTGGKPA